MKNLKPIAAGILISLTTLTATAPRCFPNTIRRWNALLAQMTLDEKIGQMVQVDSAALKNKDDVQKYFLGSVLSGGDSDPAAGNTAQDWLDFVNGFKARRCKRG